MRSTTFRRYGIRALGVVLVGTTLVGVKTTSAYADHDGCGDYVRLYQAPATGPVTQEFIGSDVNRGGTVDVHSLEAANRIAPAGNNLKPFEFINFTFYKLNTPSLTRTGYYVYFSPPPRAGGNSVLQDNSYRTPVNHIGPGPSIWEVDVNWISKCSNTRHYRVIGYLQING